MMIKDNKSDSDDDSDNSDSDDNDDNDDDDDNNSDNDSDSDNDDDWKIECIDVIVRLVSITPGHVKLDWLPPPKVDRVNDNPAHYQH